MLTATPELILEFTTMTVSGRVDREAGILYGVKVLGFESRNNRSYKRSAVAQAVKLYEGAKVNIDHDYQPTKPRSYGDGIGVLRRAEKPPCTTLRKCS